MSGNKSKNSPSTQLSRNVGGGLSRAAIRTIVHAHTNPRGNKMRISPEAVERIQSAGKGAFSKAWLEDIIATVAADGRCTIKPQDVAKNNARTLTYEMIRSITGDLLPEGKETLLLSRDGERYFIFKHGVNERPIEVITEDTVGGFIQYWLHEYDSEPDMKVVADAHATAPVNKWIPVNRAFSTYKTWCRARGKAPVRAPIFHAYIKESPLITEVKMSRSVYMPA